MLGTLAYSIAGGMLAVLSTACVEQIAWKFLRMAAGLPFALIVGCAAWSFRTASSSAPIDPTLLLGLGGGLCALALIVLSPTGPARPGRFRVLSALGGLLGIAAASLAATRALAGADPNAALPALATALIVLSQVLGCWVLGSITLAWLLGHAYLTATTMTIAPLRHLSGMLAWGMVARVLFVVVSGGLAWWSVGGASPSVFARLEQAWLIAVLRFGVGLVAVGVFAYMVLDCVKLRSTQSATGILYFGSLMAYVGELAGQQLVREVGWPF